MITCVCIYIYNQVRIIEESNHVIGIANKSKKSHILFRDRFKVDYAKYQ